MMHCGKRKLPDKDYCDYHQGNFLATGDPKKREEKLGCYVDGCGVKSIAKGMCINHYAKSRYKAKMGSPRSRIVAKGSKLAELVAQAEIRAKRAKRLAKRGFVTCEL
jgi:hypothetical protein